MHREEGRPTKGRDDVAQGDEGAVDAGPLRQAVPVSILARSLAEMD